MFSLAAFLRFLSLLTLLTLSNEVLSFLAIFFCFIELSSSILLISLLRSSMLSHPSKKCAVHFYYTTSEEKCTVHFYIKQLINRFLLLHLDHVIICARYQLLLHVQ